LSLSDLPRVRISLAPIRGAPRERRFAVYDLEWVPETYELRLAGFYDGETYRSFPTIEGLLNYMLHTDRKSWWFYAHAGGLADMHFLLEKLQTKPNIQVSASFSGSSAIVVKVTWKGNTYTFLDSYWLLRDKLAHLAPYTGYKKDRGAYVCSSYPACGHVGRACDTAPECGCDVGPEPLCMFTAPYPTLRAYNERDCRILYEAIRLFQKTLLEIGTGLRSTIASTALGLFRTRYLQDTIVTNAGVNDRIRESYIASRVEVFRPILDKPARYYDINSSFPYAMTKPCPGEYLGEFKGLPNDESTLYFADATVRVPDMFLPPLGARGRDDRIYFPTGTWRGLFSRPDLELLETVGGSIDAVHGCTRYASFTDLAAYAYDLYDRRAKAKKAGQTFLALVLKYLLNSLYGKFGEHRIKQAMLMHPRHERCPHGGAHDVLTHEGMASTCVESLFPGVILVTEERSIPHEHVAISSHITAIARATHYGFLAPCGEDLYYGDTDSLVTGRELPTGPELGALKLEFEVSSGRFVQPKLYELDGKIKSKGFSRLTPAQFQELIEGREVEVERMYRVKETARELKRFGAHGKTFGKRIRVGVSRPKRRPDGNGGTLPWTVDQIKERWSA
jgi:hypothetical protein